jgi:hypothetical protein
MVQDDELHMDRGVDLQIDRGDNLQMDRGAK